MNPNPGSLYAVTTSHGHCSHSWVFIRDVITREHPRAGHTDHKCARCGKQIRSFFGVQDNGYLPPQTFTESIPLTTPILRRLGNYVAKDHTESSAHARLPVGSGRSL